MIPQCYRLEEVAVYREAAREAYETRTAYNGEDDKTIKKILSREDRRDPAAAHLSHGPGHIATELAGNPCGCGTTSN